MTRARPVRCPGPGDRGCGAILNFDASLCFQCGRRFHGHELYEIYLAQNGETSRG